MDNSYYMDQAKKLADLTVQSSEKQETFWQHALLVFSGTFGIVVSLHTGNSSDLYIRSVFVLAVVSLALGTLSTAIVVYDLSQLVERIRQVFLNESLNALREDREMKAVFVDLHKRTSICKWISCLLFAISIIALSSYSVLSALF